jgi:hypothetical protein
LTASDLRFSDLSAGLFETQEAARVPMFVAANRELTPQRMKSPSNAQDVRDFLRAFFPMHSWSHTIDEYIADVFTTA